jgi:hypothetical protein
MASELRCCGEPVRAAEVMPQQVNRREKSSEAATADEDTGAEADRSPPLRTRRHPPVHRGGKNFPTDQKQEHRRHAGGVPGSALPDDQKS